MAEATRTCPCGRGEPFEGCCGPLLSGAAAATTAERLMRSRFTAFAVGDAAYLLRSWHSRSRPAELELDVRRRWTSLEVLAGSGGGLLAAEGTVEFRAHYLLGNRRGVQQENSRFLREAGRWVYLGPVTDPAARSAQPG